MADGFLILPCNGLDKCAGCVSREIALRLAANPDNDIICPVFYRVADARYNRLAQEKQVAVIDGCQTRCASKLAAEKGLKVAYKMNVSDEAKSLAITLGDSLRLGEEELSLAEQLAARITAEMAAPAAISSRVDEQNSVFPPAIDYEVFYKDKFAFRLPKEGFLFNENDCWVYVVGNRAWVGVTDYVQQTLSDIIFFEPPEPGSEVTQFGELGTLESGKAVFEIVSPVSGKVVAINEELVTSPELVNQNPYEKGWIAELELTDFESDRELLLDFNGYLPIMKRKVDEFRV